MLFKLCCPKAISKVSPKIDSQLSIADLRVYQHFKQARQPVFQCPICILYYNKVLECEECLNQICFECATLLVRSRKGLCPFCRKDAVFRDKQTVTKRSYFMRSQLDCSIEGIPTQN